MKSKRGGFSLLEVLLALVIFTVGIIYLINAFNFGIFSTTDVENTTLASNIAQANMETIRSMSFSSITTANIPSAPTPDPKFSNFIVTTTLSGSNPIQIDVKVTWNNGNTKIQLTTLRANG